jgi:hypothetical protein
MIGVLCLLAALAAPKTAVAVNLSPRVGLAGHVLCVEVTVHRYLLNRQLATTIDCDNFFRAWQEQLDGANALYDRRHCFDPMPQGNCVVGADLYRLDPRAKAGIAHYAARSTVCFAGGDVEC